MTSHWIFPSYHLSKLKCSPLLALFTSSNSQSWKGLLNLNSQQPPLLPSLSHKSATVAFLWDVILKSVNIFQLRLPSLPLTPKSCTSTTSYSDISSKTELFPPFSNVFPKAHPKKIPHPSSSPTPLHLPKFSKNDFPPQSLKAKWLIWVGF